jgi:transketolase
MNKKTSILTISKELGLTHLGSNLSIVPVLEEIYAQKKPGDKVILCNAHAHLAHVLFLDPDHAKRLIKQDIHCNRAAGCDASGGSLGHGIGIGIGYALADRSRDVYVVVSDGSMMEGSGWEALRIKADLKLSNLIIYTNFNGFSALAPIDGNILARRMLAFCKDIRVRYTSNGEGFEGVQGHYKKLV